MSDTESSEDIADERSLDEQLHDATFDCRLRKARRLLARGADPSACNVRVTAPVHEAAARSPQLLAMMLNAGASLESPSNIGWTPVLYAARFGSLECLRMLHERGAALGVRDSVGASALHVAAYNGRAPVLRYLLANGLADAVRATTTDNAHTPRDDARERGHDELVAEIDRFELAPTAWLRARCALTALAIAAAPLDWPVLVVIEVHAWLHALNDEKFASDTPTIAWNKAKLIKQRALQAARQL